MTKTLTRASGDCAVKTAEERVRMLLECVRLPAFALDSKGAIVFANEALLQISGYSADDLAGRNWADCLVPRRDHVIVRAALEELRRSGNQLHFDSALLTKTGEERLIAWSNAAFFSASGVISETISIGEDLSPRRQLEEELTAAQERERVALQDLAEEKIVRQVAVRRPARWQQPA